jgi:hypothetical protein
MTKEKDPVNDSQTNSVRNGPDNPQPAAASTPSSTVKKKPGAAWKANEEQHIPENRLYIVMTGLMLCTFLAAIGQFKLFLLIHSN